MSQPIWKFLKNIGDVNPLDYGGFFIYVDETGHYDPEAEVLVLDDETDDPHYTAYRFSLDKCTYVNGILSDNSFHPDISVWFADDLDSICAGMDISCDELIRFFCSDNVLERAEAYRCVGEYFGYHELDSYPLKLRKRESRNRYIKKNGVKY